MAIFSISDSKSATAHRPPLPEIHLLYEIHGHVETMSIANKSFTEEQRQSEGMDYVLRD